MMILERNCRYPELLDRVKGKKVLIWTCNTCARLCNRMGGDESASELAEHLKDDGADVVGVLSASASCLMRSVIKRKDLIKDVPDIIISLTCNMGARNVREAFGYDVIEPFTTLGYGYLDENGVPHLPNGDEPSDMSAPFF